MKDNILVELSLDFGANIIELCTKLKESKNGNILLNQLLRSGTSIGANIYEGNYASSKADFINKFQIALKECYETEYWLRLFVKTAVISEEEYKAMYSANSKLRKLLIASLNTAKENS